MQERPHKHEVTLSEEQRHALHQLISKGKAPARKLVHARILLKIDRQAPGPHWTDEQVAEAFEGTRGASDCAFLQPQSPGSGALDTAPACSSHGGVGLCGAGQLRNRATHVKKNELKPWLKECWCIPAEANAPFVWHMEDVLEVYTRPYKERFPLICMDESGKQLVKERVEGLPMEPGKLERYDYSYEQGQMYNLFLACEPLVGKRVVKVSEQKTSKDWAHFMQEVIDVQYPHAEKIILVMDNLATHSPAAFYHAFPPAQARRLAAKLEIHHTPLHGSWLNMAEIEFAALARQCLSRRIATVEELEREVGAWQQRRNEEAVTIQWRFTTADARIKLKRLYPSLKAKTTHSEPVPVAKEV